MGTNRRKHGGKKKSGKAAAPKPEPAADEPLEWVGCDACGKWRKIPLSIAEALGDDDEWLCKMNPDEAMAKLGCVAPEPEDTHDDETEPAPMEVEETPACDAPVAMGWVGCDACDKWRKVPQSIVDALGDDDQWFCKENPDRAMASCDAPEEAYDDDAGVGVQEPEAMDAEPTRVAAPAATPAPAKTPAAVTFAPDTAPPVPTRSLEGVEGDAAQKYPHGASQTPAPTLGVGAPKPETPVPVDEKLQGAAFNSTGWRRPPLSRCTPEDFMLDFARFTDSRGDDWEVVWDVLDNSLRRSGRPMDALGFYKEICARGGFVNRESAKKRIKMPDVFKQLHNHYVNHTYTDIGNNLLNTYERYFLAYEHAHPEDVPDARCVTCEQDRHGKPGQMLRCDSCGDWHHAECAAFDPSDSGVTRGVIEIVTSFVCAKCRDVARKSNVLTFESERVTRADLESRLTVRCEENFDRHLAMQKRRGRRYDPDYVRPTRDPELIGMKYSKKDDDTPIGSWAAAKHYVPPSEERPRANLLDDGWEPATAAGRAVFGITTAPGDTNKASNTNTNTSTAAPTLDPAEDSRARAHAARKASQLATESTPWVAGRAEAEYTGPPGPDMTTVGEWLASQGALNVADPGSGIVVPAPADPAAQAAAMKAAGEAAYEAAMAKFVPSVAGESLQKQADATPPEPHPQEIYQKHKGPLITHIVDGVKTTLAAGEFRNPNPKPAEEAPTEERTEFKTPKEAGYPGAVLADGMVQIAGPIWGYGFNPTEATAMAGQLHETGDVHSKKVAKHGAPALAVGIPIKPMPADYGKEEEDGEIREDPR